MLSASLSALFLAVTALGAPTDLVKRGNNYHLVTREPTTHKEFCLDVRDGKFRDGAPVQLWTCYKESDNQRWHMAGNTAPNQPNLQITIKNPQTNEMWCLATTKVDSNGAHLQIVGCNASDPRQLWKRNVDKNPPHLRTKGNGGSTLCMDVTKTRFKDGTNVQVYYCSDENPNQFWSFVPV